MTQQAKPRHGQTNGPRWVGQCYECHAEAEIETRYDHAARALCDSCAEKPHSRPTLVDAAEFPDAEERPEPPATSWTPVELAPILSGENADPEPSMLLRPDGKGLLYPGRVHSVSGEPEACKGWIALAACRERIEAGEAVLYVDFEDNAASVTTRLRALGLSDAAILEKFAYVRPDEPLGVISRTDLERALTAKPTLAVLDGVTEAMVLHGLDLANNNDAAKWLALLPRPLVQTGAAVLAIDHVAKSPEQRGRYSIGAQHKLAGIDVAFSAKVITPFGRGRQGHVKLTVAKDRPGHVRGFAADGGHVCDVRLGSSADGSVSVKLEIPTGGAWRPTVLMERVSAVLEARPGLGSGAIRQAVTGKAAHVDRAVQVLIAEGHVDARPEGSTVRHYLLRPFEDGEDAGVPV